MVISIYNYYPVTFSLIFVEYEDWFMTISIMTILLLSVWLKTPGTIHTYEGDDAILDWRYNESYSPVRGVLVTKRTKDDNTVTYLTKSGDNAPVLPQGRTEPYNNAGIVLLNVTLADGGQYESSVYFNNTKLQIHNKAELIVYPEQGG